MTGDKGVTCGSPSSMSRGGTNLGSTGHLHNSFNILHTDRLAGKKPVEDKDGLRWKRGEKDKECPRLIYFFACEHVLVNEISRSFHELEQSPQISSEEDATNTQLDDGVQDFLFLEEIKIPQGSSPRQNTEVGNLLQQRYVTKG